MRTRELILMVSLTMLTGAAYAQEPGPGQPEPIAASQQPAGQSASAPAQVSDSQVPASQPAVVNIKPAAEGHGTYTFELRNAPIADLFRVLAHDYKLNLFVDKDVNATITASLNNITLEKALEEIARSANLVLERQGDIIRLKPNLVTRVFMLKQIEAGQLLKPAASAEGSASAGQTSTIFDLLSGQGRIFLGNVPNSLMVIDYPANVERIERYLEAVDRKMGRKVFRLKYLKASELVGGSAASTAGSSASSPAAAAAPAAGVSAEPGPQQ